MAALLIPMPPQLTGNDACFQLSLHNLMLQMSSKRDLCTLSKRHNDGNKKHGAILKIYCSFGIAKALRSRHSAS